MAEGLGHHRAGRLQQAEGAYRAALARDGDQADALHLLGVIRHQQGDFIEAERLIREALIQRPNDPRILNNLGEALRLQGRLRESIGCYRLTLQLQPEAVDSRFNLGLALLTLGDAAEAEVELARYVAQRPDSAEGHIALGRAFELLNRDQHAAVAFRRAVALEPAELAGWTQLAKVLRRIGDAEEAARAMRACIAANPLSADAHYHCANAEAAAGRQHEKLRLLERAVKLDPNFSAGYMALGLAYLQSYDAIRAVVSLDRAIALEPSWQDARWASALALPAVYRSEEEIVSWRHRFGQGLNDLERNMALDTPAATDEAVKALLVATPFQLPYQGHDDRMLMRQYGQLVTRIMTAWALYRGIVPPPMRSMRSVDRIKVGFVSAFWRGHTVGKLFANWPLGLNRSRFATIIYSLGQNEDVLTRELAEKVETFVRLPRSGSEPLRGIVDAARRIIADKVDILIFPEVGMDSPTLALAASRLAPVQCASWGHPITTGLPTIDIFLSSSLMEPGNGDDYYTERLVRFPGIGILWRRPMTTPSARGRCSFGIRENAIVFLSSQSLYKYLPQFDFVFPAIAREVAEAQFVFLLLNTATADVMFRERLAHAFAAQGLDSEKFCIFLPRLSAVDYLALNLTADIYLDTLEWSGGNTTLEAIWAGLPVVTCPGRFMRGRHSSAMLRQMEMDDLICADATAYIDLAVRLARDPILRANVRARILRNCDKLFDDEGPIRALEDFIEQAVASACADGSGDAR